ncbi:MAG: EthD domain-containing protein [Gaiellales bacterium]
MIGLNWVMLLPASLTEEQFEDWYLNVHSPYVETAYGVKRYVINRVVANQPAAATGDFYRLAQEYWADWESMERCWNSAGGHVLLGDGLVNMGLDPGTIAGVGVTENEQLEVASPAIFDVVRGGFAARPDGTNTRFMALGLAEAGAGIGAWYRERHATLGRDPRVRAHVFGTTLGKRVKVGLQGQIPGPEQHLYDWNLELWFDGNEDAHAFLGSDGFGAMWEDLGAVTSSRVAALFRGQERMMISAPLPHKDD